MKRKNSNLSPEQFFLKINKTLFRFPLLAKRCAWNEEPLYSLKAFIETIILGHYPQF